MGHTRNGCGCGETPKHAALINRIASEYRQVPTVELDQNIGWLEHKISDCMRKIDLIRIEKGNRQRAKAWRDNYNAIVQQFCDPETLHYSIETRAGIVKQRLGCSDERALQIAKSVSIWVARKLRENRNKEIVFFRGAGMSVAKIAKMKNLSRQQVHNILRANKPKMIK